MTDLFNQVAKNALYVVSFVLIIAGLFVFAVIAEKLIQKDTWMVSLLTKSTLLKCIKKNVEAKVVIKLFVPWHHKINLHLKYKIILSVLKLLNFSLCCA